jgi:SAM-dependent methyltransferase
MSIEDPTHRTVAYYDQSANDFWQGTKGHNVKQNYEALLGAIGDGGVAPPYTILDVGCGPGRDLAYFKSLGHEAIGLDASQSFVEHARNLTGCTVLQQNFMDMDLPLGAFHGIFANASLFHVPSDNLPGVLKQLSDALKPNGVLFSSNPRGSNQEGWQGDRYCVFHDYTVWTNFMSRADFIEIHHYYRPEGQPREQQPWLASVWRKAGLQPMNA